MWNEEKWILWEDFFLKDGFFKKNLPFSESLRLDFWAFLINYIGYDAYIIQILKEIEGERKEEGNKERSFIEQLFIEEFLNIVSVLSYL